MYFDCDLKNNELCLNNLMNEMLKEYNETHATEQHLSLEQMKMFIKWGDIYSFENESHHLCHLSGVKI